MGRKRLLPACCAWLLLTALLLTAGCRALTPYRPTPPAPSSTPAVLLPPDPPRVNAAAGHGPPATAQVAGVAPDPRPACVAAGDVVGTVSYTAGWNLVSGPTASCLHGAAAVYLVLSETAPQPSVSYAPAPADAGLLSGEAYWVYFPTAGSLDLASNAYQPNPPVPTSGQDGACFGVKGSAAAWTLLANGSPRAALVLLQGAQASFTYQPGKGYRSAGAVPVGQAAWIWPSGSALTAFNPLQPAATPPGPCP